MTLSFKNKLSWLCFTLLLLSPILQPHGGNTWAEKPPSAKPEKPKSISLFDGKTLKGWTKTMFGGEAEVEVVDGNLQIGMGSPLTGVTITPEAFKALPKINYEISLEARRVLGGDFFVGLTIPVKEAYCSLIMGGWGGGVIGISSLDGYDAAENETTTYHAFKNDQWYKVRLQVTEERIRVWQDDEKVVDVEIADKRINTRLEVGLSEPLGLATYHTTAQIRNFTIRSLTTEELGSSKPAE